MDDFQKHYDYLTTFEKVDEERVKTCCEKKENYQTNEGVIKCKVCLDIIYIEI